MVLHTFRSPVVGMTILGIAFGLIVGCDWEGTIDSSGRFKPSSKKPEPVFPGSDMQSTPFIVDGIEKPGSFPADHVVVPDDAPVIGVVVGDEARAYLVMAMSSMRSHVINDVLSNKPVTIVYCDRADCARTFSDETTDEPLSLQTGGFMNGEMNVRLKEVMYPLSSTEIPLQHFEHVRTTWADWKQQHPETRIYLGACRELYYRKPPRKPSPPEPVSALDAIPHASPTSGQTPDSDSKSQ